MKTNLERLSTLLKTAQLGQTGIRSVLDATAQPQLRQALQSQLREYDSIELEAHSIASRRGWDLPELDPAVRFLTDLNLRMKLTQGNSDSRIADLMIQRNTRDMIRGLKELHSSPQQDQSINALSQRLLDCETANIRQLQQFL